MRGVPEEHPGRRAYAHYLSSDAQRLPEANRSSWDQVAALFAVIGEGSLFEVRRGRTLSTVDDEFEWRESRGGRADGYVVPVSEKRLESLIEELMIGPVDVPAS